MALTVKHKFVSAKVDTLDNSRVQPSNWNDTHSLQIGPAAVVGRGAGVGQADAVEIPMGATGQALLAAATAAAARATIVADDSLTTVNAAALKATPVDADWVPLIDSAAGNIFKRMTWWNIKNTLKAFFDTVYPSNVNGIFTGTITAASSFIASSATAILAATGAGTVLLRPNGFASAVGQAALNSAGDLNLSGIVNATDIKKNGVSIDSFPKVRALLSFSMAGAAITLENQFNIASVVRVAGGQYTVNFATPMANAVYVVTGSSRLQGSLESWMFSVISRTVNSCTLYNRQVGGIGPADVDYLTMAVIY